jgi:hypothetical protein
VIKLGHDHALKLISLKSCGLCSNAIISMGLCSRRTAQSGGDRDMWNLRDYFSAACCTSRHSSFKSPSCRPLLEVCWSHASKYPLRVELFGANHEIE